MGSGAAGVAGAKAGIFGLGKKAPIKKVDDIEVSIRSDTDLIDEWDDYGRNMAETNTFVDLIPLEFIFLKSSTALGLLAF